MAENAVRLAPPRRDWRLAVSALKGGLRALIRPSFLATFIIAAGIVGALYHYADRPAALWLKKFDSFFVTGFFRFITDLGKGAPLLALTLGSALLLWLAAILVRKPAWATSLHRRAGQAFFVFCCVAVPALLGLGLKVLAGRARPILLFSDGIYGFDPIQLEWEWHSMPSGHALATVGFAAGLALILPPAGLPLVAFFATMIAFSRVLTTVHYPSDAVAGAALAILCAIVLKHAFLGAGARIFHAWERYR